jgi:hypothetical protein
MRYARLLVSLEELLADELEVAVQHLDLRAQLLRKE